MSKELSCQIKSSSPAETENIAEYIGSRLKGGEVIELVSDLGGGKTTFVRGLARGMGSSNVVASPTFTISRVYASEHLELHHFDFYRLGDTGLIGHELADVINDPGVVIAVEWGGAVRHVMPEERLSVTINKSGDDERVLAFSGPEALGYLIEGLVC